MYKHIMQKYVHLSAHYGGLSNDFITVKDGDHHLLGNLVFINQPVDPTITNGAVSYERETYP